MIVEEENKKSNISVIEEIEKNRQEGKSWCENEGKFVYDPKKRISCPFCGGKLKHSSEIQQNFKPMEIEEFIELPIPENQEKLEDVALIMCLFHYSPSPRIDALRKGINQLRRLNPLPKIIFYEAGYYPIMEEEFKEDIYKFIKVGKKNHNLWQKENLFNLAAKDNLQFKYLIFHDGDTYPEHPSWAMAIKQIIASRNGIVQNGYYYEDTIYKNKNKYLYVYSKSISEQTGSSPGLSISMNRETYEYIEGFPDIFPGGSGDAALVVMNDIDDRYTNSLKTNCRWWKEEVGKSKKKVNFYFAPYRLTHFSHGPFTERGYYYRNKAIEWLGVQDIREYLRVGTNGLLEAKKDGKKISHLMGNKHRMGNAESTMEVVREALLL